MAVRARTGRRRAAVLAIAVVAALMGMFGGRADAATGAGGRESATTTAATPTQPAPLRLSGGEVRRIAREAPKLRGWRDDHPTRNVGVHPNLVDRTWTVEYRGTDDAVHAQVIVDDVTASVREVRTGPQVAWQMARGYKGAFGRSLTKPIIWIPLIAAFLLPLIRWRRPLTVHTLDLLVMCSFAVSLVWFNRGEISISVPLVYPPLVYLFLRLLGIAYGGRRDRARGEERVERVLGAPRIESPMPTWLLVAIMCLVMGLRLGLNAFDSNVIDVGYAGVIGADRIAHGQTPYGTFPSDCSECDTYGPLMYQAYVPFELFAPWTGRWNDLPAAHAAAVAFDLIAFAGLLVLGWRLGGRRVAVGLGLAWTAFPFTVYALESNSNDSLVAALLVWGLVAARSSFARGASVALAAWAKFAPALLVLLWMRHPFPRARRSRRWPGYVSGLVAATLVAAWPLLLDGTDGLRRFWSRTLGYQLDRESPFSIWGMHPQLRPLQIGIQLLVAGLAIAAIARPRRLDLRRFAALSGALLIGMQLTMPHWFYLYIPWFIPLAFVVLVPTWRSEAVAPPPPAEGSPGVPPPAAIAAVAEGAS